MKKQNTFKNIGITVGILAVALLCSFTLQELHVEKHSMTTFVFAVFLISLLTDGYIYGVISAILGVLAVNYAFTFPYFQWDFITTSNLISAVIMVIIAILTGTLTTKLKEHEAMKAESEKERMYFQWDFITTSNLISAVIMVIIAILTGTLTTKLKEHEAMKAESEKERMHFQWDFITTSNLISAVIMVIIAILTGTLTTKLKEHEAMKAESEKERMRANLLRAISHDIRTPLTTIYGASSTLREKKESLTTEQQDRILKSIQEDAKWLTRMVENLLSITKIDDGRVKIIKVPIVLDELMDSVENLLSITKIDDGRVKIIKVPIVLDELMDSVMRKFHAGYPEQEVNLDIPDEILVIPMDAILIEQVLVNLLENAVLHADGMTKLTLRPEQEVNLDIPDEILVIPMDAILIEQVLVNLLENAVLHADGMTKLTLRVFTIGDQAIFEIEDDGCGIKKERLHHIFTGCYDALEENSDTQKRNAGIGLSVCATIVKAHGGEISVENRREGGAVFHFSLAKEDEVADE